MTVQLLHDVMLTVVVETDVAEDEEWTSGSC